jgi:hypothetical protein
MRLTVHNSKIKKKERENTTEKREHLRTKLQKPISSWKKMCDDMKSKEWSLENRTLLKQPFECLRMVLTGQMHTIHCNRLAWKTFSYCPTIMEIFLSQDLKHSNFQHGSWLISYYQKASIQNIISTRASSPSIFFKNIIR